MSGAWATIDSPLGELVLEGDERGVTALRLGPRRAFDLPLAPAGGDFDLRVWRETSAIPWRKRALPDLEAGRLQESLW